MSKARATGSRYGVHKIPALALPGANQWNEQRDAHLLDGIKDIIVITEPDAGGEAVKAWLSQSVIRHRARVLLLKETDPNGLFLKAPERFIENWHVALLGAMEWSAVEAKADAAARNEAWNLCGKLAHHPDILSKFAETLKQRGVAGEQITAKILFLALTSRLLQRPVSCAIKGPSSGGKSFIVETVSEYFPPPLFTP